MEPDAFVSALERIVVGSVALTSRALNEAAPGMDLTFPQWRALLILGEDPAGVRVGHVAVRVGVTLPATSRLLRRLERRGLVAVATDAVDRRAIRARLTDGGEALRSAIITYRREALRRVADEVDQVTPGSTISAAVAIAAAFGSYA